MPAYSRFGQRRARLQRIVDPRRFLRDGSAACACVASSSYCFEHLGRLPPDVTVVTTSPDGAERAVVIEVKLSSDRTYLLQGLHEAHLYRAEYAPFLTGWPKAILVASGDVPGEPRRDDDVIAVPWHRWVPEDVLSGILASVAAR